MHRTRNLPANRPPSPSQTRSALPVAALVAVFALSTLGAVLLPSIAQAEFSVQIGAFREPAPTFTDKAEKVGKLYRSKSPAGLVRLQVGRFATKKEANVARSALLGAGYDGAFVVQKGVRLQARTDQYEGMQDAQFVDSPTSDTYTSRTYSGQTQPSGDPMAGVPADLRDRVVILDGRLHVVEGNQFTPLDQYLRNRPQY